MKVRVKGMDIDCTVDELEALMEKYGNAMAEPVEPTVPPAELEALGWAPADAAQSIPFAGARRLVIGPGVTLTEFSQLETKDPDPAALERAERIFAGEAPWDLVAAKSDWKRTEVGELAPGERASRVHFCQFNIISTFADGGRQFTDKIDFRFGPLPGNRVAKVAILAPVGLGITGESGLAQDGVINLTFALAEKVWTLPGFYFAWEVGPATA